MKVSEYIQDLLRDNKSLYEKILQNANEYKKKHNVLDSTLTYNSEFKTLVIAQDDILVHKHIRFLDKNTLYYLMNCNMDNTYECRIYIEKALKLLCCEQAVQCRQTFWNKILYSMTLLQCIIFLVVLFKNDSQIIKINVLLILFGIGFIINGIKQLKLARILEQYVKSLS